MLPKMTAVVRLARDVEIKYSQSGNAIASFSVVSSKKYKTKNGEQKEDVTFIDCTAFSRLGEVCNQFLKKGSQIFIIGELKLDQWQDQSGNKRSKHSILLESMEMLGNKDQNNTQTNQNNTNPPQQEYKQPQGQPQENYNNQQQTPQNNNQEAELPELDINEDQIPF